jgi:hypothetical protein
VMQRSLFRKRPRPPSRRDRDLHGEHQSGSKMN